jgi:hypothetical protein
MKLIKEIVGEVKIFFAATTAHGFQYLVSHESHGPIRYQCYIFFITDGWAN